MMMPWVSLTNSTTTTHTSLPLPLPTFIQTLTNRRARAVGHDGRVSLAARSPNRLGDQSPEEGGCSWFVLPWPRPQDLRSHPPASTTTLTKM
jgi:hypothetical protein